MSYVMLLYLLLLSIQDIRERQISTGWLAAGTVITAGYGSWRIYTGAAEPAAILAGCLPGLILLGLSVLGKQIGTGDGWVLAQLGCVLETSVLLTAFSVSLILAALYAGVLLAVRRAGRKDTLPYLPFLTVAVGLTML